MIEYAKNKNIKYTEIWKEHSIESWRTVNMIRRELNLPLMPMLDILKLSVREIVIKALEEQKLEINQKIEETKETKTYRCELCGVKTTKLHRLRTGQLQECFPDKRVCWDCYLREHKKLYEGYGKCLDCHTRIKLDKWPNFICKSGHINNVNFIEFDTKRLLDDIYGKIREEDYKKLHDRLLR